MKNEQIVLQTAVRPSLGRPVDPGVEAHSLSLWAHGRYDRAARCLQVFTEGHIPLGFPKVALVQVSVCSLNTV